MGPWRPQRHNFSHQCEQRNVLALGPHKHLYRLLECDDGFMYRILLAYASLYLPKAAYFKKKHNLVEIVTPRHGYNLQGPNTVHLLLKEASQPTPASHSPSSSHHTEPEAHLQQLPCRHMRNSSILLSPGQAWEAHGVGAGLVHGPHGSKIVTDGIAPRARIEE